MERLLTAHYEESVPLSKTYGCFSVIIMFNVLTGVLPEHNVLFQSCLGLNSFLLYARST